LKPNICVIGLGYVGLPLAVEFSKQYKTIGFDINDARISELRENIDVTEEVTKLDLEKSSLIYTSDINNIKKSNIYVVTVPTPIDESKKPDLRALMSASKLVGSVIKQGDTVIYESTVYPGCTMEECVPIIEKESKLFINQDFNCGYSPERINPGDKERTLTKITKITSGSSLKALKIVDDLYASILVDAKTFPVDSIEIAEAAKVIENAQRDLNIAFVNELALVFEKMNIETNKVIEAASTKWNFLSFKPGIVGGHCIGVDPYYLTYKSNLLGYTPEVILAGRKLNDNMGKHITRRILKLMVSNDIRIEKSKVLILGLTFKENCPDIRNTKVIDIVNEFNDYGVSLDIVDPWANGIDVKEEYGMKIKNNVPDLKYDAVVLAVAHNQFLEINLENYTLEKSVIFDIKSFLPDSSKIKIHRL